MATTDLFRCILVHPKLFPGVITDPGNPLRVDMLIEVGPQDLLIRASAPRAKGKIMGTEPLAKIERVAVERLAGGAQRTEILRRSLRRAAVVGGIVLVFALFLRSYPPGLSIFMGLILAAFIGSLNFVLNGGLGSKRDVVRFHFFATEPSHTFYLEVPPAQEMEIYHALCAAGLRVEVTGADQEEWTCDECGAVVDARAATCPQCGASFDE